MKLRVAAVAAFALLATPAFADAPVKNGKYRGTTSQDRKLSGRVTSDGKRWQFEYDSVFTCTDGTRLGAHAVFRRQAPTIKADGSFDYRKTYTDQPPVPGFGERRTERQRVTGRFTHAGRRVNGTVTASVYGKRTRRSCRYTLTFRATLKR